MGQAKRRANEISELKNKLLEVSLHKNRYFEITELFDFKEQKKCLAMYKNAYTGNLKSISNLNLYGKTVRFIVYKVNGKFAGFIRINDKSAFFQKFTDRPIWSIADGFTSSDFRNQGILRKLIQYSIEKLNVKMFFIDKFRYFLYKKYYFDIGFTRYVYSSDGMMVWGFLEEMQSLVPASIPANTFVIPVANSSNDSHYGIYENAVHIAKGVTK